MSAAAEPLSSRSGRGLLLACEGVDDEQFLVRMLAHLRITEVIVRRYGGKPRLSAFLLGLRDSTEFESVRAVGILRDADLSAAGAFQSVGDRLQRLDLPRPRWSGDLISGICGIDGVTRTVGVFIMPGDGTVGALEDLYLSAIAADSSLPCVDDFLTCVSSAGGINWREQDRSKSRINAWLASRVDPTRRLGQALGEGIISADAQAFGPIKQFLLDLAEAASAPETPAQ